jgi:hypothetical protein
MAEYEDIYASIVKFTQDFIKTLPNDIPATFVDFDQHASADTLPSTSLVGIRGLSVDSGDVTLSVTIGFGISTVDDKNMFKHRKVVDRLFTLLQPTKTIPFRNATTGNSYGYLKVAAGTLVLPVSRAKTRAFQEIAVNLLGDRKPTL